jgi:hypothetical protein
VSMCCRAARPMVHGDRPRRPGPRSAVCECAAVHRGDPGDRPALGGARAVGNRVRRPDSRGYRIRAGSPPADRAFSGPRLSQARGYRAIRAALWPARVVAFVRRAPVGHAMERCSCDRRARERNRMVDLKGRLNRTRVWPTADAGDSRCSRLLRVDVRQAAGWGRRLEVNGETLRRQLARRALAY